MRSVAILYVILVGWPGCRLCDRGCGYARGLRLGVWGVKGTAQVITELTILYFKENQNFGEATRLPVLGSRFLLPFTIRIYAKAQMHMYILKGGVTLVTIFLKR